MSEPPGQARFVQPTPPDDPSSAVSDPERVRAVRSLELLDTAPEEVFDRMTRLAATVIGVPASFISLVDAERDFYKSQAGMPEPLATERQVQGRTFCHYTLRAERALALDDVTDLPVFRDVPTVCSLGVRAYLGVPMRTADGFNIGSFCAIDVRPRHWSDQDINILTELAHSAMREIELRMALRNAHAQVDEVVLRQRQGEERGRLTAFSADVGLVLSQPDDLQLLLQQCAEAMVRHLDAALARIWTINDATPTLQLQASAGLYTHLDGPHGRVPVGALKIGQIAATERPHLTNDLPNDERVGDRAWALREGLAAFAGYPLIVDDRAIGVVAMFARQPISDQVLKALGVAAHAMANGVQRKRAIDALRAADRRKDVFVATMAHEVRQPLAALMPAVELMKARISEESMQRARDVIARQLAQLQRLVDDLMDVAGVAAGKIALQRERIDVAQVVLGAADSVRALADQRQQSLSVSAPNSPVWSIADSARLHQVFSNLITNAIKYTQVGGQIQVILESGPRTLSVTVRDNGRGISREALPYIFDLFMQEGAAQRAGLGIGLHLVRGLVNLHGGTVEARSEGTDRGSELIVTLTREDAESDAAENT